MPFKHLCCILFWNIIKTVSTYPLCNIHTVTQLKVEALKECRNSCNGYNNELGLDDKVSLITCRLKTQGSPRWWLRRWWADLPVSRHCRCHIKHYRRPESLGREPGLALQEIKGPCRWDVGWESW